MEKFWGPRYVINIQAVDVRASCDVDSFKQSEPAENGMEVRAGVNVLDSASINPRPARIHSALCLRKTYSSLACHPTKYSPPDRRSLVKLPVFLRASLMPTFCSTICEQPGRVAPQGNSLFESASTIRYGLERLADLPEVSRNHTSNEPRKPGRSCSYGALADKTTS